MAPLKKSRGNSRGANSSAPFLTGWWLRRWRAFRVSALFQPARLLRSGFVTSRASCAPSSVFEQKISLWKTWYFSTNRDPINSRDGLPRTGSPGACPVPVGKLQPLLPPQAAATSGTAGPWALLWRCRRPLSPARLQKVLVMAPCPREAAADGAAPPQAGPAEPGGCSRGLSRGEGTGT